MFEFLKQKPKPKPPTGRTPIVAPAELASALGKWIAMTVPNATSFVGYVYFDRQAGLSAKGGPLDSRFVEEPALTVRLPMGAAELLTDDEVAAWKLPASPPWLVNFGEQTPGPWRTDPALAGQFHPSFINDLQILVHDGEPRRTGTKPELCWVRVGGAEHGPSRRFTYNAEATKLSRAEFAAMHAFDGTVYLATLLNQPHQLTTVKQGNPLCFYADASAKNPFMVSTAYLAERASWRVQPCNGCGMCEGLDPPSVMAKTRFPDAPAGSEVQTFTAFCVVCGGMQLWTHEGA